MAWPTSSSVVRPAPRPWVAYASAALCLLALVGAWLAGRGDWRPALELVGQQGVAVFVAGAAVCALSLALRAVRWRLLLLAQGHRLPWWLQVRVYLAGIALSATPGKLGETWRSALLRSRGVPVAQSLGAFLSDRLSDVIGLATLGGLAAWVAGSGATWLAPGAGGLALASLLLARSLRRGRGATAPAGPGTVVSRWRRRLGLLVAPLAAWASTWRLPVLVGCAATGAAAFGVQALFMVACVQHLGQTLYWVDGLAVFAAATLLGAASMMPGGLGAMDLALVLQLQALGVARPEAVAATLITRLCTLGFGWVLGLLALGSFSILRPAGPGTDVGVAEAASSNPSS